MKNKNGFISMTLVYTFLIIFLFLMVSILSTFSQKNKYYDLIQEKIKSEINLNRFSQRSLNDAIKEDNTAYSDSVRSLTVNSDDGIDFNSPSSNTNGKGLFYNSSSGSRVYYYRGNVDNNYLVIGNKCYRIIRTAENNSVKVVASNNETNSGVIRCTSGYDTIEDQFNVHSQDNAYIGYNFENIEDNKELVGETQNGMLEFSTGEVKMGSYYRYNFDNGTFSIRGIKPYNSVTEIKNESGYRFMIGDGSVTSGSQMIRINPGDESSNTFSYNVYSSSPNNPGASPYSNTPDNINSSVIRNAIEYGALNELRKENYFDSFMDDVLTNISFCNDKSTLDTGIGTDNSVYHGSDLLNDTPRLSCSSSSALSVGNGLNYPVSTITADEAVFSGLVVSETSQTISNPNSYNSPSYLFDDTTKSYWTMTPYAYVNDTESGGAKMLVIKNGKLVPELTDESNSILVVYAIKGSLNVTGHGTAENPYKVVLGNE